MAKSEKNKPPVNIEAFKYKDRRANIPTKELRDFVVKDEASPKTILYPRDPSLDPQLVWKGKDEQDAQDLEVPAVPVYIQEKIHPKHIIEDLRAQANKGKPAQLDLFADFNGIKFEEMVEFYQHEQNWSNRMILGDSLLVMTSLSEKEGLKGRVQVIYIDPPYGIKFGSNWQVSTRKRDVKDGSAGDATRQPEQIKAFRDTWKLGIHSYLAYLRDRLVVVRDLLTETGSVFVQIGDENVHLVRCLMDEVFGSENFISLITVMKTTTPRKLLDSNFFYIIWYGKNGEQVKYRQLFLDKPCDEWARETPGGSWGAEIDSIRRPLTPQEKANTNLLPSNARVYQLSGLTSSGAAKEEAEFSYDDSSFTPGPNQHWKTTPEGMEQLATADRIERRGGKPWFVKYHADFPCKRLTNIFTDTSGKSAEMIYVVQTQPTVIARCLLMTTDPGDLVLDPTCGSGTTAYVAEQWGRRWITLDTSRVALALARTRLMAARFPYYVLADSSEGIKKETELTGRTPPDYKTAGDIRKGFVYERVPHITLKSIANNPDIKEGMSRKEIDVAIARYTETETLYDQPYEDNKPHQSQP